MNHKDVLELELEAKEMEKHLRMLEKLEVAIRDDRIYIELELKNEFLKSIALIEKVVGRHQEHLIETLEELPIPAYYVSVVGGGAGTSMQAYFTTSYKKLVKAFGPPLDSEYSDGKVSTEWVLSDGQNFFTIYDYKATSSYDEDSPTVEEFRALPSYQWHIGAKFKDSVPAFIQWLKNELGED